MTRWLMAVLFLAASGAAFADAPPPIEALNPQWGIVFQGEKARELVPQCSRQAPGPVSGVWTPTAAQISELESELMPALMVQFMQRELAGQGWNPHDYYRQYGGLVIKGQRVIYVNGIHRQVLERPEPSDVWKTRAIGICDGGELAFGVEYDPATKAFANFRFNGRV